MIIVWFAKLQEIVKNAESVFCFSELQAGLADDDKPSDPHPPLSPDTPTNHASTSKSKAPLKKGMS